jgi:hypothetical protein
LNFAKTGASIALLVFEITLAFNILASRERYGCFPESVAQSGVKERCTNRCRRKKRLHSGAH